MNVRYFLFVILTCVACNPNDLRSQESAIGGNPDDPDGDCVTVGDDPCQGGGDDPDNPDDPTDEESTDEEEGPPHDAGPEEDAPPPPDACTDSCNATDDDCSCDPCQVVKQCVATGKCECEETEKTEYIVDDQWFTGKANWTDYTGGNFPDFKGVGTCKCQVEYEVTENVEKRGTGYCTDCMQANKCPKYVKNESRKLPNEFAFTEPFEEWPGDPDSTKWWKEDECMSFCSRKATITSVLPLFKLGRFARRVYDTFIEDAVESCQHWWH